MSRDFPDGPLWTLSSKYKMPAFRNASKRASQKAGISLNSGVARNRKGCFYHGKRLCFQPLPEPEKERQMSIRIPAAPEPPGILFLLCKGA